ncbi:hypothetical protein O7606_22055 [Micromonospora sp. WMMD882]|uniref:hypothetical protein n=1 Tax=Micromonospora sp. WMMD882 TaxID=3015151 RepID=UPI00248AFB01|nr:hypothetical protein [Micromonospora sp. WMMD882]WBB78858.1 hypothetical protein O7606_22055 [Micromonospora sp. WMMD882]
MMVVRRAVEFLLTRVLRSRVGVALGIAVLVLGVIGAARLVAGPLDPGAGLSNRPDEPITTVDPNFGDDGAIATAAPPSPVTSPGADPPEQVTDRFVSAWLGGRGATSEEWLSTLRPFATPGLLDKMDGAEPAAVPAERATGPSTLRPRTESFVEASVPLDTGRLRLELVASEGRWLVDVVDWERA